MQGSAHNSFDQKSGFVLQMFMCYIILIHIYIYIGEKTKASQNAKFGKINKQDLRM